MPRATPVPETLAPPPPVSHNAGTTRANHPYTGVPTVADRDDELSLSLVRRAVRQGQPGWLHTFTAVFAAVLLAGTLLLLGVRAYLHWSVSDALRTKPAGVTSPP